MTRWIYYASARRGAMLMAGLTDADLCPDCGHPGYDGHDMRLPNAPCFSCACGHEDDRDWRLDRWIEATLGTQLHRWAATTGRPVGGNAYMEAVYVRWAQLHRREREVSR